MMQTVNVVEISDDGTLMSLKSFPDTVEGHLAAQAHFITLAKEITNATEEDITSCFDGSDNYGDCYLNVPGGGMVQLFRST